MTGNVERNAKLAKVPLIRIEANENRKAVKVSLARNRIPDNGQGPDQGRGQECIHGRGHVVAMENRGQKVK